MTDRKLYLAYGANTNRDHMQHRCPDAVYIGNAVIRDHRLIFRSVADVIEAEGHECTVALWWISRSDEQSLDRFEGYPRLYTKRYITVRFPGGKRARGMLYVMAGNRRDRHEPPQAYENTLHAGYEQCGIPLHQLWDAIAEATDHRKRQRVTRTSWDWSFDEAAEQQEPAPLDLPPTAGDLNRKLRGMNRAERNQYITRLMGRN